MKRALPFVIIALVLGAALLLFMSLQRPTTETTRVSPTPSSTPTTRAANNSNQAEPGAEPPHAHGNPNATVTLEEFGDFQCPPCGMLHPVLKDMEAEFGPAKLRVIFREFPLVPSHAH